MQIHELTHNSAASIMEAGFMDYVKSLKTPAGMAGMSWDQRAAALARDKQVQDLGQVAMKSWLSRAYQLAQVAPEIDPTTRQPMTNSNGQPVIKPLEYQRQLADFVDSQLLQGSYRYLDPGSKRRVDAVMREIVAAKDDPKALETAFLKLTPVTTTAIQTTQQARQSSPRAPKGQPAATIQPQGAAQTVPQEVQAVRDAWNNVTTQAGRDNFIKALSANAAQGARRTGNAAIDDFLINTVGLKLS